MEVGRPNQEPAVSREVPLRFARFALSLILLPLALSVCGGDSADTQPRQAANPLLRPAHFTETAPATFRARVETSVGDWVIELHRDWAPVGVDRFYNLAKNGFYDDTRVYRVLEGFMAQFGLNGDPYVNQAWKTQFIVDDPVAQTNSRGRVTYAKGGLHTRTVEVFVNYQDNPGLDADGFSPIGEVVEGMDVVDAFYAEYGDGPPRGEGPYAAMAQARGNEYLDEEFPELTRIIRVTVEEGG
jgi:peptidyl-prolyl cis-trans isomerase A (cyclophilin A)